MLRWNPLIITAVKQRVFGAVGCLNATIEPICLHLVLKLKDLGTVTLVTCFLPSLCIAWEQICYWNVLICTLWHLFVPFHFLPCSIAGYLGLLMGLIIGSHALLGSLHLLDVYLVLRSCIIATVVSFVSVPIYLPALLQYLDGHLALSVCSVEVVVPSVIPGSHPAFSLFLT